MSDRVISLTLNGQAVSAAAEPRTHLADFIREDLLLTGTHIGCEQGVCGACTIFVDGRPTRSCITLAASCEGADVRTVEGFNDDPLMARIRESFSAHHALQCGYCTPGMLTTAYDIARRLPGADAARIRRELSGNLCRCTGYAGIVEAIEDVLANGPPAAALAPMPKTIPAPTDASADRHATSGDNSAATGVAETPSQGAADFDLAALADAPGLTRSLPIAAGVEAAWAVLSDPEKVVTCVPGASLTGPVEDGALSGQIRVAVGPIKAAFLGTGSVTYESERKAGHLVGKGRDTISRTALEGKLTFTLIETGPDSSRLDLDMRYRLAGPLSQFGRPELVAEIADRLLGEVGAAVEARIGGEAKGEPFVEPNASLNGLSLLFAAVKAMLGRVFRGG